jgi:16S rRNA (guanine966-N2)-methyltransferase
MEHRRSTFNRSPGKGRSFERKGVFGSEGQSRPDGRTGDRRRKRTRTADSKLPPPRPGTKPRITKPWEKTKKPKITSEFQITDGRHQGKLLENIEKINPVVTSRKLREALFRLLARRVRAGRFLDLCAGNGTMGLEALSRGAMLATFVERSLRMCTCIRKNLESCGVKNGHSEVVGIEAIPFIRRAGRRRRFWDIVYCDPPAGDTYDGYMKCFGNGFTLRPGGLLVLGHNSDLLFPDRIGLLKRWRVITKDGVSLSIYERQ